MLGSLRSRGIAGETGTLEVGKSADVVMVDGNPAEDIKAMHAVDTIVTQGRVVKRNGDILI